MGAALEAEVAHTVEQLQVSHPRALVRHRSRSSRYVTVHFIHSPFRLLPQSHARCASRPFTIRAPTVLRQPLSKRSYSPAATPTALTPPALPPLCQMPLPVHTSAELGELGGLFSTLVGAALLAPEAWVPETPARKARRWEG
jgi:hypothetical protein